MGRLVVIATPIGNLEDITLRALRTLKELQYLACEDTRQTRKIFERYEIPKPKMMFSYHVHNEESAGKRILHWLEQGESVGLCSDAGTPAISDPGYAIVRQCLQAGYAVEVLPGACAAVMGLVQSGLPSSSYTFRGFPPRKSGKRHNFFALDADLPHTLIYYESPQRLGAFLEDALAVFGNREACVCIEMTKMFESHERGYLQELMQRFQHKTIKGELTIVIAGNHSKFRQEMSPSEKFIDSEEDADEDEPENDDEN